MSFTFAVNQSGMFWILWSQICVSIFMKKWNTEKSEMVYPDVKECQNDKKDQIAEQM
jgi:hypothetical protein